MGIDYIYTNTEHNQSHGWLLPVVGQLTAEVPSGARVLDLGCGNGSFIAAFRDRNWVLYGADFSPTGIEQAQTIHKEIEFFVADAANKSLDDIWRHVRDPLDLIISTEVIEHLYNPRAFLSNCLSLLKPGGVLVLSTPYHGYLKNLALATSGKMETHFTVLWDHGHIKFWSRRTLSLALTEAGFSELKFAGSGRMPWLWKSMVMKATKPFAVDFRETATSDRATAALACGS
jgi:2-polyprenyl-6-hydroxyphenyl methylase/3-demethylubiquinone-9 3-methyltransferase